MPAQPEPVAPRPAVGFSAWPSSPPLPPLAHSPPCDAVHMAHNPMFLQRKRNLDPMLSHSRREPGRQDHQNCELIVLLDSSKQQITRRQQTNCMTVKNTRYTTPLKQTFYSSRLMTARRHNNLITATTTQPTQAPRTDMNLNRHLSVLETPTMSPLVQDTRNFEYEPQADQLLYDFPTSPFSNFDYPTSNLSPIGASSYHNYHSLEYQPASASSNGSSPGVEGDPNLDFVDMDALLDCDITSLDAYIHDDTVMTSYDRVAPQPIDEPVPSSSSAHLSSTSSFQAPLVVTSGALVVEEDLVDEFFPQLSHQNKATPSRARHPSSFSTVSGVSETSSCDISDYRLKRDKNNVSSQRSRAKRQNKVRENKEEKERLEKRRVELTAMVNTLQEQVEDYKRMVMMFVGQRD